MSQQSYEDQFQGGRFYVLVRQLCEEHENELIAVTKPLLDHRSSTKSNSLLPFHIRDRSVIGFDASDADALSSRVATATAVFETACELGASSAARSHSNGLFSELPSDDLDTSKIGNSASRGVVSVASAMTFGSLPAEEGPFRDTGQPFDSGEHSMFDYLNETFGFGSVMTLWTPSRPSHRVHLPRLRVITQSSWFTSVVGLMILFNAICVALDGDARLRLSIKNFDLRRTNQQEDDGSSDLLDSFSLVFCIFFALELILRAAAEGIGLYIGADKYWNMLDTVVVLASLPSFVSSDGMNLSFARLLRVMRLSRALRTARVLKYFQETRVMLTAVLNALQPLVWSAFFVALVMFLFGVFLMYGATEFMNEQVTQDHAPETASIRAIKEYLSSFPMTMLSLFMSISGGQDWWEIGSVLVRNNSLYGVVFVVYISLMILGLMNVITGVFVTTTADLTKMDRETAVQTETAKRIIMVRHLKKLFEELDEDGNGELSWHEFEQQLETEAVVGYLSALEINVTRARALFKLLDINASGTVSVDEFVMGCLRLKGGAKTLDVGTLMYETRALKQLFLKEGRAINRNLRELEKVMNSQTQALHSALQQLHTNVMTNTLSRVYVPITTIEKKTQSL